MARRRDIAGYPCTETILLGRLRHDTRPGLTRWRVTIHNRFSFNNTYTRTGLQSVLTLTLSYLPHLPLDAESLHCRQP